jgi:hypothetical protein
MPVPISRQNRFPNTSTENILRRMFPPTPRVWTRGNQQHAFDSAMTLLNRGANNWNVHYQTRENVSDVLTRLARNYNRTWNATRTVNGSNAWRNSNSNSNSNNRNTRQASPQARNLQAPNYSKASGAVKKWLSVRPHTVH